MKKPPRTQDDCDKGTRFVQADCVRCRDTDVLIKSHCRSKTTPSRGRNPGINNRLEELLPTVDKILNLKQVENSTVRDMYFQRLRKTALQLPLFIAFAITRFKSRDMQKYRDVSERLQVIGALWQSQHGGINLGKAPAVQYCVLSVVSSRDGSL